MAPNQQSNPAAAIPVYFGTPPPPPAGGLWPAISVRRQNIEPGQTDAVIGLGTLGDYLEGFLLTPLTTAPGAFSVRDGNAGGGGTYRVLFVGGLGSLTSVLPFSLPFPNYARNAGGWNITTGANLRVQAFGNWAT
jgi:hypothetical protein